MSQDAQKKSTTMRAYLALERLMFQLDADDPEVADVVRDAMDHVWWALTDAERRVLVPQEVIIPTRS